MKLLFSATALVALVLVNKSVADEPLFPPPESPLDCHFEDNFCGWQPAGIDTYQWQRRGYLRNQSFSPREGYLSYKYAFVNSSSCAPGQAICQAALISVPVILDNNGISPVSPLRNAQQRQVLTNTTDWCFEFYYFIANNQSSHSFDIDVFVDKQPDLSPQSNEHGFELANNPEWTLSAAAKNNPLAASAGRWRHATVNLKWGYGKHQVTLVSHVTKSGYDASSNGVTIAIDGTRLYKGQCVELFEQDILTLTVSPNDPQSKQEVFNIAVISDVNLWAGAVIPYVISDDFNGDERSTIRRSMGEFGRSTCIRFKIRTTETDYLDIVKESWCYSYAGRITQPGFYHEHSRNDRDDYIDIQWDNIAPGSSNQFQKYTLEQVDHLGLPYDYDSVMHYSRNAYARLPGLTTIETRLKGTNIGQRERLSDLDIRKINKKYQCLDGANPEGDRPLTNLSCNFETNMCGWVQSEDADPVWAVFDPATANFEAPTLGSSSGVTEIGRKAAVVDLSGARKSARLTSPRAYSSACFSFAYFFSRYGQKSLRVVLIDNTGFETTIWKSSDQGDSGMVPYWQRGRFVIPLSNYRLAIEAEPTGPSGRGSIAIDDFNFTRSANDCAFTPIDARPIIDSNAAPRSAFDLNCTFERTNFCGWINVRQVDDFDWTLKSGRTYTASTGPGNDHTLGNSSPWGLYALASAVNATSGETARLVSPALTGISTVCLRFYYHMFGQNMGVLRVYKRLIGGRNPGDVLTWEVSGDQGTSWRYGDIRMTSSPDDRFQMIFEATMGNGIRSDIALDDISVLLDVPCPRPSRTASVDDTSRPVDDLDVRPPPTPSTTRTTWRFQTRPTPTTTTTRARPSNQQQMYCTFDGADICSWQQDGTQDDADWQVDQATAVSHIFPGSPFTDRTTLSSSGYFMYLDPSNPRQMGDVARLRSVLIADLPLKGCLRFWYSMNGQGIGELRVVTNSAADGSRRMIWRLSDDQGPQWNRAQIPIDLEPSGGRIFVEGVVGVSYTAVIAVDDLSFSGENCDYIPGLAAMVSKDEDN